MYATIIDGKLATHEGVPSLADMQKVVGGYITTALRANSPTRKHIAGASNPVTGGPIYPNDIM